MISLAPKTQKAKGIVNGIKYLIGYQRLNSYRKMYSFFAIPNHTMIKHKDQITSCIPYPCFARPCPTQPRHGFVDSKVIHSRSSLIKLFNEIIQHDAKGELLLGPCMKNVISNAVYVSSGNLAIGRGNDGATAGKKSICFPVAPHKFATTIMKQSGLKKNETVYLESILAKKQWWLTQIRGGPAVESISPDYIPRSMKIKAVVLPHNDLLVWEKEAKNFKPGTVVYGNGHTLASHAAIHCVLNKIPFVTTFKPVVGKIIKPAKLIKVRKLNRIRFKQGTQAGLDICKSRIGQSNLLKFFYFSLSVLHNWAYIKHSKHADWLLGAATIIFAKLCASLIYGEFRHSSAKYLRRDIVYNKTLRAGSSVFAKLPKIFKSFYSGNWDHGFGGVPWANCTWYTHSLWEHIVKIYNKNSTNLTEKEISDIIGIVNKTVNVAHNNGWWFNKIACKADMDFTANNSGLAAYCVAEIYDGLHKKMKAASNVNSKFDVPAKFSTPFAKDRNGKLAWIYIKNIKYSKTRLSIFFEGGKRKNKTINLSASELKAIHKLNCGYGTNGVLLPASAKGKFKIPGGKFMNVNKVFEL